MPALVLLLSSLFLFSACATRPLPIVPVLRAPMPMAIPQSFRTSMSGLLGEEVELTGIYSVDPMGALLLLRSGEQLSLRDAAGKPLAFLAGLENRSQVRLRGRLITAGPSALVPYSLEVRQFVRIA